MLTVKALAREWIRSTSVEPCRTPKECTKVEFINISPSLANAMLCVRLGRVTKFKIMREIKFRAWDESQKYMAYQGTPDLETLQSFMYHFGDKPLMQFTGHKDCDGKEIFDGDILGDWNDCDGLMVLSNEVVYFDETLGSWMLDQSLQKDHSFATSLFENLNDFTYKVIGNVYENPDLVVVASEADA